MNSSIPFVLAPNIWFAFSTLLNTGMPFSQADWSFLQDHGKDAIILYVSLEPGIPVCIITSAYTKLSSLSLLPRHSVLQHPSAMLHSQQSHWLPQVRKYITIFFFPCIFEEIFLYHPSCFLSLFPLYPFISRFLCFLVWLKKFKIPQWMSPMYPINFSEGGTYSQNYLSVLFLDRPLPKDWCHRCTYQAKLIMSASGQRNQSSSCIKLGWRSSKLAQNVVWALTQSE